MKMKQDNGNNKHQNADVKLKAHIEIVDFVGNFVLTIEASQ